MRNSSNFPIKIHEGCEEEPPENSKLFSFVLRKFNKEKKTSYSKEDILRNLELFREFQDFFLKISLKGEIQIEESEIEKLFSQINKIREKAGDVLKEMDRLHDEIYRTIYAPLNYSKNDETVKEAMHSFRSAYSLMKQKFHGKERDSKNQEGQNERYFNHLQEVMKITLYELPNPNIYKVLIAILHDSIEDIKHFNSEVIETLYGKYVARGVLILSKRDWQEYLDNEEIQKLKNPEKYQEIRKKAKERRNQDYFGNLKQIEEDDFLDVKFADRIHNLRTLFECDYAKIHKKIKETEKYFLEPAYERNKVAYDLMVQELDKLKKRIGLK